jgi:hypothetical protein
VTAISRRRTAAVALCLRFSTREIVATDSPVEVLRAAIDMPCSSLQKLERRLAQPGTLNNASVLADTARHQLLRLRSRLNGSFDLVMNLASGAVPDLMLRVIEGTTTVANMVELERPAPVPRSACRPASATRGRHRVTAAAIRRPTGCPRSYENPPDLRPFWRFSGPKLPLITRNWNSQHLAWVLSASAGQMTFDRLPRLAPALH